MTQIIWNIIGCPRIFSALWNQNFLPEERRTLYYTWNFSIPRFLWKVEGMATNFFVTVTPKIFDGKTWYPPFSSTNPFGNRNFIKNSWISRRTFSAAWGIKISTENRDLPPLVHNFFSIPWIYWKKKGFCT